MLTRFLLYGLAGTVLLKVARAAVAELRAPSDTIHDVLETDPICGVRVPRRKAVVLQRDTGAIHFCSATCRDRYVPRAP